jgi:hypothetical protein
MGLLWGQEQFVGIIFFLDCIFLDRMKKKKLWFIFLFNYSCELERCFLRVLRGNEKVINLFLNKNNGVSLKWRKQIIIEMNKSDKEDG